MRSIRTAFFIASALLALLSSCSRGASRSLSDPPSTPVLSRQLGWAVVDASYAQVYDLPSAKGVLLGYYRKGAILPIVARQKEQHQNSAAAWLRNEGPEPGWVREADVLLFDSPDKAATAAKSASE